MPERTMMDRMLGAAMLDVAVYEEVEADRFSWPSPESDA